MLPVNKMLQRRSYMVMMLSRASLHLSALYLLQADDNSLTKMHVSIFISDVASSLVPIVLTA